MWPRPFAGPPMGPRRRPCSASARSSLFFPRGVGGRYANAVLDPARTKGRLMGLRRPFSRRHPSERGQVSMARPLAQFALTGLLALVVVAVIGYFVLRNIGTKQAIRDGRHEAAQLARHVV